MIGAQPIKLKDWLNHKDLIVGLLLSSLLINIVSMIFPLSLLQVYDRIIPNASTNTLVTIIIIVIAAFIIELLLKSLRAYVAAWADTRLTFKRNLKAFKHLVNTKISEYEREGAGVHLDRLNSLDMMKDFYGGQAIVTYMDIPFLVMYLWLISLIGGYLVVVPITVLILMVLSTVYLSQQVFDLLHKKTMRNEIKINFMVEMLTGIHTVKSLAMEEQLLRRYERLENSDASADYELAQKTSRVARNISLFSQLNLIGIVSMGAYLNIINEMTVGGVAAATILAGKSIQPISKAMNLWNRHQSIKIALEGEEEIYHMPLESSIEETSLGEISGHLILDNVSYSYPGKDESVLENVSIEIQAGECVAILGDGLSGKTTLISLMTGLLTPTSGKVLIDNKDITQFNLKELRRRIALLPQTGNLFDGTIMQNITMFREDEYHEKAVHITRRLGLHSLIEHMSEGYKTLVGSGNVELISQGFKQGILIGRALIDEPKLILFDEANSAMDIATDDNLKMVLSEIKGKATMVLVTHRPSILKLADRAYALKDKKLYKMCNLKLKT